VLYIDWCGTRPWRSDGSCMGSANHVRDARLRRMLRTYVVRYVRMLRRTYVRTYVTYVTPSGAAERHHDLMAG
jgi:hypothetical protein